MVKPISLNIKYDEKKNKPLDMLSRTNISALNDLAQNTAQMSGAVSSVSGAIAGIADKVESVSRIGGQGNLQSQAKFLKGAARTIADKTEKLSGAAQAQANKFEEQLERRRDDY